MTGTVDMALQFFDKMKVSPVFKFLAGTLAPIHKEIRALLCRDLAKTMPVEGKKQE
jgi:hypothetical protein